MSRTVSKVIGDALRLLKVKAAGESLDDSQADDGMTAMNDIFEEWNLQNLAQTNRVKLTQALTGGDGTYTFGSGGDNSTRPLWVDSAYIRTSSGHDYPVNIIDNEEYSEIFFKTLQSSPSYNLYYRAEYPLGVIELYPVPSVGNTLHLEVPAAFDPVTAVTDVLDLAPGYLKALKYQLAVAIAPEYKIHDSFSLVQSIATETMGWIKRVNRKDRKIMHSPLDRMRGGAGFFFRQR